ncbi:hypothetical protein O6H91_12G018800 [Diphasiastrum complanatum]|uniref:Uncharacterized protein n=1 Tax=Diphasiastrum complanatum TaxID=34168 RepID=A0ACC2BZD6_DIPCM|nr:hypothetical protein O6H91_12G018800 [Diphasiastrum complanatum]
MLRAANARAKSSRICSSSSTCYQLLQFYQNCKKLGFTRSSQNISYGIFGQRGISVSHAPPKPSVDQSFSSTYSSSDGKVYTYATVIVRAMGQGHSAALAWSHACSLITPNFPTCAVAFVSKPTVSAEAAVKELAQYLHDGKTTETPSPNSRVSYPQAETLETVRNSEKAVDTAISDESSKTDSGMIGYHTHACMPPLIGCVVEGLAGDGGRKQRVKKSDEGQGEGSRILRRKFAGNFGLDIRPGPNEQVFKDGDVGAIKLLLSADMNGHCTENSTIEDKEEEDDDDDDDVGTFSDWDYLLTEYDEWKGRNHSLDEAHDSGDSDDGSLPDFSPGVANFDRIKCYRERFIMFQRLLKPNKRFKTDNWEMEGNNQDLTTIDLEKEGLSKGKISAHLKLGKLLPWNKREDWIALQVKHLRVRPNTKRQHGLAQGGSSGHEKEVCTPSEAGTTADESKGQLNKSEESVCDEEEEYQLILCVAHLPGTKVVAFHSSTTSLPNLPDLEVAVTSNNPHMVLLGAPGFPFPEFMQRLSTVFPENCRAGAFLAPIYNSGKDQHMKISEQKSAKLFIGTKQAPLGVVGLSISSDGLGVKVPMNAFAEFIRTSLGVAWINGHTFLDDNVSKSLFLPRNVILEHSMFSQRASSVDPMLILQQLNLFLMRHTNISSGVTMPASLVRNARQENAVEVVKNRENMDVSITKMDILGKEGSQVYESLSSMAINSGDENNLRQCEMLPLALFDAVLFPGWSMPFYIYEPCYKFMVRQCVEHGKPFGLSTVWHTDPIDCEDIVGTMANLKVYMFEKDCGSFIVAHGVRRFRLSSERLLAQLGSFGLNMGQVQYFDDSEFGSLAEKEEVIKLAKHIVNLCRKLIPEADLAPRLLGALDDPTVASFAVGHFLPVPTPVKRRWLSMVNTKDRLLEQLTFLNS